MRSCIRPCRFGLASRTGRPFGRHFRYRVNQSALDQGAWVDKDNKRVFHELRRHREYQMPRPTRPLGRVVEEGA